MAVSVMEGVGEREAVMSGGGVDVGRGAETTVKAVVLPVAYSTPLNRSRVRNFSGALTVAVNLVSCALAPTILLIVLRDGGPSAT